ncbi:hypothetical protein [Arthrobacter bambusae]|uniref:hypothetical protein n=1 Tax=Arthrobacter bambusae TaxID=1338426 RepID=UPI0027823844|nr:hypothetical protein [Arthrobacter bambusae]MDQ0030815.1 integrase [Arthrobacter bambusae]MDQ0099180.1 integrase [Arthrobacter bambusae]
MKLGLPDPEFPRPTLHDLHPTAVSLAVSASFNVKVIQRIAGHASATMTLDTYTGLSTTIFTTVRAV